MFVFGTTVSDRVSGKDNITVANSEREEESGLLPQIASSNFGKFHGNNNRKQPRRQRSRTIAKGTKRYGEAHTSSSKRRDGRKQRRDIDQINDLMAEERAVLEQLEATRARLREKLANSADYQVLGALTNSGDGDGVQQLRSKNQISESIQNAPLGVAHNLLPALTNTGEPVFEAGLREDKHVLPIFQLPPVAKGSQVANPLPQEPTDEEKERLQAEINTRAKAQSHLGLSEEEIRYFEALMSKQPGVEVPTRIEVTYEGNQKPESEQNRKPNVKKRARPGRGRRDRASALRKELSSSIKNVQSLTALVHDEMAILQRQYPEVVHGTKSKAYVQRWAVSKMSSVFEARDRKRISEALQLWSNYSQYLRLQSKHLKYQMMQGAGKLAHIIGRLQRARLTSRMRRWVRNFQFERNNEEFVAMSNATQLIQRCWRGYQGRLRFQYLKYQQTLKEQHAAAAKLQTMFRGRHAKQRVANLREEQILFNAARKTQTAFRGRLARKRMEARKARLEAENRAALKVQSAWRRRQGQLAYHILRRARRDNAAAKMQALQRRKLAKRKADAMRVHQRKTRAAIMVQRAYRSRLAYKRMAERRKEFAAELAIKERAALRLQAIYRGHRGRLIFQLKNHAKRAAQEQDELQIQKVQSLFRGKLGRRKAADRRKEYLEEMCSWARSWVEEFDSTSNDFVFRNLYTQQVLFEPPPDGYTKKDGMLALLDGRVIEDPVIVAKREREKNLLKCIECDGVAATRRCHECDDIYCDECYDAIHLKGALASHSFEWFQDGGPKQNPVQQAFQSASVAEAPAADWIELFDEDSGYPYWYDQLTGTTTW